jgi:hypothetical protein
MKALWSERATGSVLALAKAAHMSYSSTHAELRRLERASLVRSKVLGSMRFFEANKEHPLATELERLVHASSNSQPLEKRYSPVQVMANLASLGAPIRVETSPSADFALEEAVAQGLRLTHSYPTLARAYPVLLARNRNRLNLERLRQLAVAVNEKHTLGFFLELTAMLGNDQELRTFAQALRDRRVRRVRDFFEGPQGKYARKLADLRTPEVARAWLFRMNMDLDNFRDFFSKFRDL